MLPRPDFQFKGKVGKTYKDSDPPQFPQPVKAPKRAPNVVVNLAHIDEIGGPRGFNHFPSAWAHAVGTPFQWTKQVASHPGGARNPMIVSWPARIRDRGGLRTQFLHVIDIVPTLYEAIGITPPTTLNGVVQRPIEGASFLGTFADAKAPETRRTQYFEMFVNRGTYHDGWMASSRSFVPWDPVRGAFDPFTAMWELDNLDQDFSQANDVAAKNRASTPRSCLDRARRRMADAPVAYPRRRSGSRRHRHTDSRLESFRRGECSPTAQGTVRAQDTRSFQTDIRHAGGWRHDHAR